VQASSAASRDVAASPALARKLAGFFRYMALAGQGDFLREVSELDLSLTQLKGLSVLDERGELSVKALAEELGLSLPTTSRAVDGLFKRGLVERDEDPDDRRVRRLRLTRSGQRVVANLMAIRVAGLSRMLKEFSEDERTRLAEALDLILERDAIRALCPGRGRAR
jgi:DNA-binding MarR family transcriptional regulator